MIDVEAVKSDLKGRKAMKLIVDNAKPVEKEKEKRPPEGCQKEGGCRSSPVERRLPKAENNSPTSLGESYSQHDIL